MFASLRSDTLLYQEKKSAPPVSKIYTAMKQRGEWDFPEPILSTINDDKYYVSNGTYSTDGARFFFTKCRQTIAGGLQCAIYMSNVIEGVWQEPVILNKSINAPKSSNTQPAIRDDGQDLSLIHI